MEDGTGTTKYSYDNLSRLVRMDGSNKQTISYTYDAAGNRLSVQSRVNHLVKYNYDKMNRINQVQYDGQSTQYGYDANGNQTKMIHSNGMKSSYTFDGRNLLTGIVNTNPDGTEKKYYYNYDEEGLITKKQEPTGTTTYEYNGNQQLVHMVEPDQRTTSYTYDKAGNRSTQKVQLKDETSEIKYTYNKQNRLTQTVEEKADNTISSNYKYDDNGNQISVSEKDSSAGSTKTDGYAYDEWNQLIQINGRDGNKTDYSYYANGLRATKSDGKNKTDFTYDGTDLLIEKNGDATQTNIYGTSRIATMGSQLVYYQYNNHGDVTGVLDAAGTQKNEYEYDAFGNVTKIKEAFSNPYRYAGYYQDTESNLYYLQSRYYNARTARFLSEDTASGKYTDPLSLNKYTYCQNQPVTAYDPDGHFGVLAAAGLTILGAAVVSGGVSAYFQHKNTGSVDFKKVAGDAVEAAYSTAGVVAPTTYGLTGAKALFATLGSGFMASAYGNGMKQLITEGKISFGGTIRDGLGGMVFNLGFSQCGNMMGKILASAGKNAAAKAGGSTLSKCLREGLKTGFKVGAGNSAADITRQAIDNKGLTKTNWKEVAQNAAAGFGFGFCYGAASSAISIAKGARGAGKATKGAGKTFGNLSNASKYGIDSYSDLSKSLKGTGLQAHHIVEKRLANALGISNSNSKLSVAVSKGEHQAFTNAWRKAIPYGTDYSSLSKSKIWNYAKEIYKDNSALLDAAKKTIFN